MTVKSNTIVWEDGKEYPFGKIGNINTSHPFLRENETGDTAGAWISI